MNNYEFRDNLFYDSSGKSLNAKDLFSLIDSDLKNNKWGIRFSKLGLNVVFKISLIESKIRIGFFAVKSNNEYPITSKDGDYLDYIIIDNTWYYLAGQYEEIIECLNKVNIHADSNINFPQYMKLIKTLTDNDVTYIDSVETDSKNISIVDFVFPGYLGDLNSFNNSYFDSYESAKKMEQMITPIMIRRLVKDVAKDLPERIDIPQPIEMTHQEALLYEDERKQNIEESLKALSLDKIQKLRMFCTHPYVYNAELENIDPLLISQKYTRLCEIMEEIVMNNEKTIIFTSFNRMIDLMVKDLKYRFGVPVLYLNGGVAVNERQTTVDEFSNIEGSAIIVCNPRVAGAGLNITAANHVIHYNLEWNPAIEDQASARAFRRGQEKTVFVHRLYYVNTIEEIMNERIQNKRYLSETAVIGNNGTEQDKKDLIKALSLSPYKEEDL